MHIHYGYGAMYLKGTYACTSTSILGAIQRSYYDGKEATDKSVNTQLAIGSRS